MLKIRLKPAEKFLINGVVLSNGEQNNITLILHNDAPVILREADIMAKLPDIPNVYHHLYFVIQATYISGDKIMKQELIDELSILIDMCPDEEHFKSLKEYVENDHYYKAIKELKKWKNI